MLKRYHRISNSNFLFRQSETQTPWVLSEIVKMLVTSSLIEK